MRNTTAWFLGAAALVGACASEPPAPVQESAPPVVSVNEGVPPTTPMLFGWTAPERQKHVGETVNLTNVRVREVFGQQVFWIGPGDGSGVPVVWAKRSLDSLKQGDIVDVHGTLERAEKVAVGLSISKFDRERVRNAKYYVKAERVERAGVHLTE